MGGLYEWIRNIVFYMILNTIIMNLLGNSSYKKYISIASGMILVLIVIMPLTKYLKVEDTIDYYMDSNYFAVETADFENSLRAMEKEQQEAVFSEYSNKIHRQVEVMLQGEGLVLTELQITFNRDAESIDFGSILGMEVRASSDEPKESKRERIMIEDITLGSSSKNNSSAPTKGPSPAEIRIKINLSDFYNIEPDNINISIQGG